MTTNYAQIVKQSVPVIDSVVADYAAGYVQHILQSITQSAGVSEAGLAADIDFVGDLLKDAGGDKSAIESLSSRLKEDFAKVYDSHNVSKSNLGGTRKLDKDTLMSVQQRQRHGLTIGDSTTPMDLDLLSGRKIESKVDKKKLEKAEKKIAAKLAKRKMKFVEYEASKLINDGGDEDDYDSFFLTVNPLDLGPSEGKSKDIKIENFDLHVGAGQRILSDATLTLSYGRRYGLVGQNGIGKSTLLKALARRELPVPRHITVLYVEQEVTGDDRSALQTVLDANVWRKHLISEQTRIQSRTTEIGARLEALSKELDQDSVQVKTEIASLEEEQDDLESNLIDVMAKLEEIESDKAESRAASILSGLGFSHESQLAGSNTFSGGWRMRLSLARALFCKPDLLMLDEPSNMLDIPSIVFLSNYLQTYPGTVLVVSHDRELLNEIATDIIYQHSERLDYYRGSNFDNFDATREERRKNAQREYENQLAYRKHLQAFIDKFRYNAGKAAEAQSKIKKIEKLPILDPPEKEQVVTFRFPDAEKLSPPIIQLQDVTFGYSQDKVILKDIDLDVQMDSRIALVGGNGCGKTTLLKLLLENLKPLKGFVNRNGRLRVGYFAQHHVDAMDITLSPVAWMAKISPGKSEEEYRRLLGAFGITGTLGLQKIATLSGGQKSRVAFACLGLSNPHVLVLDEPSNHLDISGLDALSDALVNFKGGVLMVSHDVSTIKRVCKEIWVTEEGTVRKFPGSIDDYKKYILSKSSGSGIVKSH